MPAGKSGATASDGALRPPEVVSAKQKQAEADSRALSNNDGRGSLILRIKRKRGTDPITALRIETLLSEGVDPDEVAEHAKQLESGSPDDKADASARAKRRLTKRGVFRLAETVSLSSFTDVKATRKLEQRISALKSAPHSTSPVLPQGQRQWGSEEGPEKDKGKADALDSSELRFKIIQPSSLALNKRTLLSALKKKSSAGSLRSRASLAKHGRNITSKSSVSSLRKTSDSPGTPRKSAYPSKLRFIDAVMERSEKSTQGGMHRGKERSTGAQDKPASKSSEMEMDSLDRRFADLLGNYLKENDMEAPKDLYEATAAKDVEDDKSLSSQDSDDEYVYDIYFREKEAMWGSGPTGASDAGLRPAEVAGREGDSLSVAGQPVAAETQMIVEPMATLVGFTDEDDLIAEMENASRLMAQEVPGDSDDEFDEGEDEDSNDEGFYRNDYPEDEGEQEDDVDQAGWGWSGPRRRGQRASGSSSSEGDDDDDDDDDEGSDLHH